MLGKDASWHNSDFVHTSSFTFLLKPSKEAILLLVCNNVWTFLLEIKMWWEFSILFDYDMIVDLGNGVSKIEKLTLQ